MNNWNDLSLKEKADVMKVAIGNGIYSLSDIRKTYNELAEGGPENNGFVSELDWSPESWFSKRVAKPDGTYYTDEDAAKLASHVPEYLSIEEEAKNNGTWLQMLDGSKWTGDPRSWVMMQSEAYRKNYSPKPWWTGQAEWPTKYDYGSGTIDTNKVTRAPYYNNQMWFSDNRNYGQTFADHISKDGLKWRYDIDDEKDIKGHNFLAGIPIKGNYRTLESPNTKYPDKWQKMPFDLINGEIKRLPENEIYRGARKDGQKVLTDDVVNWSKDLGDQGIFMQNINDGPIIMQDGTIESGIPINEFISQPGFTDKVKFIEGNTGDFDINNPYKYSYIPTEQQDRLNITALGGPLVQLANRYEEGGDTNEYNNIIDWIINEEGFNSKPENIGDGKITLGSGLTNPKWLKMYEEKGVWTPEDNRTAVTEEVENRRKWSEENVPNWIELPTDSQNALLSYKYNYDFTPKNSPLMFQALRDKNWEEAARQINATSSNPKFKKGLQARRQREQEMFMRGIDSMNVPEPEVVEEPVIVQEEPTYTPPQSVLDNIAANNGKYMITGYPALATPQNVLMNALRSSILGIYASKAMDWAKRNHLFAEGGPLVETANKTL